jgi:hypothetical protein
MKTNFMGFEEGTIFVCNTEYNINFVFGQNYNRLTVFANHKNFQIPAATKLSEPLAF